MSSNNVVHSRHGNNGSRTMAIVNAYQLTWSDESKVYQYADIQPLWQNKSGEAPKVPKQKGIEILQRLQTTIYPELFPRLGAFDGKGNLYSFVVYGGIGTGSSFEVPVDGDSGTRKNPKKVNVTITFVKTIDVSLLRGLFQGSDTTTLFDAASGASSSLNMLNLFVQAQPRRGDNLYKGNSFYVPDGCARYHEIDPLRLWHGFFQSVRPALNEIIVNVDVTAGVVMPKQSLEEAAARFVGVRDAADLRKLKPHEFRTLRAALKGLKITVAIPKQLKRRPRPVKDIIPDVGSIEFDGPEGMTTVADHFFQKYKITIAKNTLGIKIGQGEMFPINVCDVEAQLYKPRLSPKQITSLHKFMPRNPSERLERIKNGWNELGHTDSEFLTGAHVTIDSSPIQVEARILPPRTIGFGSARPNGDIQSVPLESRNSGVWDAMNKRLFSPAGVRNLMVVNFTGTRATSTMRDFVIKLVMEMKDKGMAFKYDPPSEKPKDASQRQQYQNGGQHNMNRQYDQQNGSQGRQNGRPIQEDFTPILDAQAGKSVKETLLEYGKKYRPNLMLVFLPSEAEVLYNEVKRFGDVTVGVATQCIRWTEQLYDTQSGFGGGRDGRGRGGKRINWSQYQNNLILKINGKLGGVNYFSADDANRMLERRGAMVIGADVSHPSPGSMMPSIASLVASYDRRSCRYTASVRVQHSRTEIIQDLSEMLESALETYRAWPENNGRLPRALFFFRDGVSEGEFERVRQAEFNEIVALLVKKYAEIRSERPTVTFIVVGKRHHFRFFPTNGRDADRTGNYRSGLVVDKRITHPIYRDFYLQSQAGLKGTSVPSHYTVLEDENLNFNADELQELAYSLCHCYSRATRAVKIPAPVYYADLVCRRAKFHYAPDMHEELSAQSDVSDDPVHLDFYKSRFSPIHKVVSKMMYFL